MRLVDTVALIAAINPHDKEHRKGRQHLEGIAHGEDIFVPSPTLIEFDLELKSHGFTDAERTITFEDLAPLLPAGKILPQTVTAMARAAELTRNGMSYFDALIVSLAQEIDATVITTDRRIAAHVLAEW